MITKTSKSQLFLSSGKSLESSQHKFVLVYCCCNKFSQMYWLTITNLFSYISGVKKFRFYGAKIQMSAELTPLEAPGRVCSLPLPAAGFPDLWPHYSNILLPLSYLLSLFCSQMYLSPPYKDTCDYMWDPPK